MLPSLFVTVTTPAPGSRAESIVIFAVSGGAHEGRRFTEMPVPEKDALAPLTKPVPVIVMVCLVAP